MCELIKDKADLQGSVDAPLRKTWDVPTLVRLDAGSAEGNPAPGVDGFSSAS